MGFMTAGAQGQVTRTVTSFANDGAGSLRDILSQSGNGDTINFNGGGTIQLTEQLSINTGVTINGTGEQVTLDGIDQSTRLVNINAAGATVTLNNLSFINGGAQGGNGGNNGFTGGGGGAGLGGAILAQAGNVVLVETVFQNNVVVGGNGGTGNDGFVNALFGGPGAGAGGGGLSNGNNGPGAASLADGEGFVVTVGGQPGGNGGTSQMFVTNAGGASTGMMDQDASSGASGAGNMGGGGGGGAAVDGAGGDGGAGGFGGGGGGGGDGATNDMMQPTDGLGGDGGFGGGGGGGQSNFVLNPMAMASTRGGLGGIGGGNGELNAADPNSASAGGGGAGFGAAVFVASGATITLVDVDFTQQTGNVATAGVGGSANAGSGSASGSFLFSQGGGGTINLQVNQDQDLNLSQVPGQVFIGDPATATVPPGTAVPFTGLNKLGEGTLRLLGDGDPTTADINLGGQNSLTEGAINLDASFSSPDFVNVVPNALDSDVTLFGEGQIGTLINQTGRVNPGDGPGQIGTLTVTAQFSQLAGGSLDIEVGPTGTDLLRVVSPAAAISVAGFGVASLNGDLNFVEIEPGVPLGTPFVFLEAETIDGAFDNVNAVFLNGSVFTSVSVASGTRFDPTVAATLQTLEATFGAVDPLTVLDTIPTGPGGGEVLSFVNGLLDAGDAQGPLILNGLLGTGALVVNGQFSPSLVAGLESQSNVVQNAAAAGAAAAANQANAVVRARVSGAGLGRNAAPNVLLLNIRSYEDLFSNPQPTQAPAPIDTFTFDEPTLGEEDSVFETRPFALWAEGVVGQSEVDADGNGLGFETQTTGITAGAEWVTDDGRTIAGVFVGSTETEIEVDGLGDDGDVDAFLVGVYGSTPLGGDLSVNGSFSVGVLEFDSSRPTGAGTARSDSDGFSLNGSIELLKNIRVGRDAVFSPFVGLEGSFVDRDGFTESGAGALNLTVDDENDEYLTGLIGVQWAGNYTTENDLRWRPAARVALGGQFLDESASTTSSFTASPGTSFTSTGAERGSTSVRVGASVEVGPRFNNAWAVFARYTGDFSSGSEDHIGQFGVRFAF